MYIYLPPELYTRLTITLMLQSDYLARKSLFLLPPLLRIDSFVADVLITLRTREGHALLTPVTRVPVTLFPPPPPPQTCFT